MKKILAHSYSEEQLSFFKSVKKFLETGSRDSLSMLNASYSAYKKRYSAIKEIERVLEVKKGSPEYIDARKYVIELMNRFLEFSS